MMNKAHAKRSLLATATAAVSVASLAFGATTSAGAAPAQNGAAVNCAEYAPVYISTNVSTVQAGQSVTITGILLGGDTVTIKLVTGVQTVTLGTVTADSNGRFTVTATIPQGTPSGTATIQATSPNCPTPISTSIAVVGGTSTTTPGPAECETGGVSFVFPTVKLIDWDGYNPKVEYTPIVPVSLSAGQWNVVEAVSWDSYPTRGTANKQASEIWEIEFLAGGEVVARSGRTEDLEDFVVSAEWRGSLGTVTLPVAVDGIRAHHLPDVFPDLPWGQANSVFAVSATMCSAVEPTSTTEAGSTTTAPGSTTTAPGSTTTAPGSATTGVGSTSTPTTVAGLVDGTTTTAAVLGSSVTRLDDGAVGSASASRGGAQAANLAWTGSSTGLIVRVAAGLIAVGALFALRFRRNELAVQNS